VEDIALKMVVVEIKSSWQLRCEWQLRCGTLTAGESAGDKVVVLLEGYRKDGTAAQLWEHTQDEWARISGS
jgi:hypothetical protein